MMSSSEESSGVTDSSEASESSGSFTSCSGAGSAFSSTGSSTGVSISGFCSSISGTSCELSGSSCRTIGSLFTTSDSAKKSTNGADAASVSSIARLSSETGLSSRTSVFSAIRLSSVEGISSKSTPSLSTTVSNCENGLFTSSFITASGVKVILLCPSINTRSPVFTLILSRSSTLIILKVPKPFTFTALSCSSPFWMISNISFTKDTACFFDSPFRSINFVASSLTDIFAITQFLHSLHVPSNWNWV